MGKNKVKRPSLKKVLRRLDQMLGQMFGDGEVDLTTLPCLRKAPKEKITANFDADLLAKIRAFAAKNGVSYTNVMNDALRKVFGMA
jgi:uncharacterized protein (DUF4415 family)